MAEHCARALGALAIGGALAGCGSGAWEKADFSSRSGLSAADETDCVTPGEWPQDRRSARRTGYAPSETALTAANVPLLTPLWHRRCSGTRLSISDGVLITSTDGLGKVVAYQPSDGSEVWASAEYWLQGPIAATSGALAIREFDGAFAVRRTSNGAVKGRIPAPTGTEDTFRAYPPLATSGNFVYGSDSDSDSDCQIVDGAVVCTRHPFPETVTAVPLSGAPLSSFQLEWDRAVPALAEGNLFFIESTQDFGQHDTIVTAHSASDGALIWRSDSVPTGDAPLHPPAVADGRVFALTGSHRVAAHDQATGAMLWTRTEPFAVSGLAAAPRAIFVSSGPEAGVLRVEALAPSTGSLLRSLELPARLDTGELIATPELVLLGVDDTLVALDAASLTVLGQVPVGGFVGSPIVSGGRVYVGNGSEIIALVSGETARAVTLTEPTGEPLVRSKSLRVTAEVTGDTSKLLHVSFRGCLAERCEYTTAPTHFGTIYAPPFTNAYPIADIADGPLTILARAFYSDGVVLDAAQQTVIVHRHGPNIGFYQPAEYTRGHWSLGIYLSSTLPVTKAGYRYCIGSEPCTYEMGTPITPSRRAPAMIPRR